MADGGAVEDAVARAGGARTGRGGDGVIDRSLRVDVGPVAEVSAVARRSQNLCQRPLRPRTLKS